MKRAIVLVQGLLLLTAIGCSGKEDAQASASNPPAPVTGGAPAPAPPSTATPAPAPAPAARPIATSEGTLPGTRVDVLELKRSSGGSVTLRFAIVNGSDQMLEMTAMEPLIELGGDYPVAKAHLIDPIGRKKYFVARDSEGKCVCSGFQLLDKGKTGNHWAKFGAPADGVERLTVVIPPFAPMDDVPIAR